MCISPSDLRNQEEAVVWDMMCEMCRRNAERLLTQKAEEERVTTAHLSLFDLDGDDFLCEKCKTEINDYFNREYVVGNYAEGTM